MFFAVTGGSTGPILAVDVGAIAADYGPTAIRAVGVILATKILVAVGGRLTRRAPAKFQLQAKYLVSKVIWAFGIIILMSVLGININSFLALFGIVGLAAALIFTPIGQNAIAGFLAGIDNVVQEGDVVEVLGRPGTVVRKGMLSIGVEFPDGSMVYMPNTKAVDDEWINHTRVDGARIEVEIKLDGRPDKRAAVELMERTLDELEWRRQDKPTAVHFIEIGSNAFHYHCHAWIDRRLDEPQMKSTMLTALVYALEDEGFSVGETGNISAHHFKITTAPDNRREPASSLGAGSEQIDVRDQTGAAERSDNQPEV